MEQTNSSTTQQHYQHEQDELDIGLLFRKIWLQKNIIVGFVFIVVLLVMSGFSMSYLIKPPVKEYSRVLQLNFPSASTGNYPSGQRFAASDILSVKVLREVYKINDLGSHNLDERKFLEAFSVSHYATNVDYINKKFASLLANDKLSRPEIEGLEEEYLQQLNTARAKFVKIAFVNSSLLTLNNVLIDKVLIDIPKIWSRMSIKELGVLNLKVTSGDYYEIDIGERLEYVNMLDYLRKGSDDLDNALSILLADEIGGSIQNIETGMSVMDLKDQLDNLTQFEIQPLFSTITNLGIVKSKFKAKLYLQNTIQDLSDQKISLQEKQRNYQLILDAYVKRFATGQSQQNNTTGTKNSGFTQFDGSFFDRITAMIEDKSDTKYKQKLLDGQLAILQEIETTNSKLLKLQRALLQLDNEHQAITDSVKQEYINGISYVNTQLIKLIQEYKILLTLRNERVLGSSSALYEIVDNKMSIASGLKAFVKQTLLFSVLAAILSLLFAVVISMLRKLPEENTEAV